MQQVNGIIITNMKKENKTHRITFRLTSKSWEMIRVEAERSCRSFGGMVEAIIKDYCSRNIPNNKNAENEKI